MLSFSKLINIFDLLENFNDAQQLKQEIAQADDKLLFHSIKTLRVQRKSWEIEKARIFPTL